MTAALMTESPPQIELARKLVAAVDAVIAGVDQQAALAAIEMAALTMSTRALANVRQARMLEMIARLARATDGPDDPDAAVAWLTALDLIEQDDAGGFRHTEQAHPRVV